MIKWRFIIMLMAGFFLLFGTFNAYAAEETTDSALLITPETWDSGTIDLGTRKVVFFTIRNAGGKSLVLRSIGLKGDDLSAFSISGPSLPMTLDPSGEAVVQITFQPTTVGFHSAALDVQCDEGGI